MVRIEFTGVSGVGKSTLYRQLTEYESYYRFYSPQSVIRSYSELMSSFIGEMPVVIQSWIAQRIWNRLDYYYYEQFIDNNPLFPELLKKIDYWTDHDTDALEELLVQTATRYQLGVSTVKPAESLVIDEGFIHRGSSIAARTRSFDIPVDEYLQYIPLPDIVVYVTAPDDIVNRRRQSEGNTPHNISRLTYNKRFKEKLVKKCSDHDVNVLIHDNSDDLESSIENLRNSLSDII